MSIADVVEDFAVVQAPGAFDDVGEGVWLRFGLHPGATMELDNDVVPAGGGGGITEHGEEGFAIEEGITCGDLAELGEGGQHVEVSGELGAVLATGEATRGPVDKEGHTVATFKQG